MVLNIDAIKAFTDNYIWCINDGTNAIVVDPGDANAVIKHLEHKSLKLTAILITHHHNDHIGGVSQLKQLYDIDIYSSIKEIATHLIADNSLINLNLKTPLKLKVIAVPGHTLDHLVFYGDNMLFCGDTLFSVGCGRVFEGTYPQMYNSLLKIKSLDSDTLVYPAHEYTIQNIAFATTIDPDNKALQTRYKECLELIANNTPTVPIRLGIEKLTNPFLRCDSLELKLNIGLIANTPEVEVFTEIRTLRNSF